MPEFTIGDVIGFGIVAVVSAATMYLRAQEEGAKEAMTTMAMSESARDHRMRTLVITVLGAMFLCFGAPAQAQVESNAVEEPLGFQIQVVPSEIGQPFELLALASAQPSVASTVEQDQVVAPAAQSSTLPPPKRRRISRKVLLWILGALVVVALVCPQCAGG